MGGTELLCFGFFVVLLSGGSVEGYKNYTVGDSLGWYDKLEKPDVDYQKWVAGKDFSLGDFLIFNTDNNHSIIQTYNFSTYRACDYSGDDITEWSTTDPSAATVRPATVAVSLVKQGMTYFFSGDYDGEQCRHGQRFKINVTYGQGLPPSLKNIDAPAPANPDAENPDSAPDTVVSSSFDHPINSTDAGDDENDGSVKKHSGCSYVSIRDRVLASVLGCFLVLLGVCRIL
ncbi:hypothetical protein Droror1_Dr00023343 [Drosera rotundifolia]